MPTPLFPVLFLGHGSPMNALEKNIFSTQWETVGKQLPRPDAIVCISAHWLTIGTKVTFSRHPRILHDFGGFPKELSDIVYPASGNPELAREIIDKIGHSLIETNVERGLDHGCWSLLVHLYPDANIPVIQLSLDESLPSKKHFELARKLFFLREQNVLILCSGNIVHNLRKLDWSRMDETGFGYDWAENADNLIKSLITSNNTADLCNYQALGDAVQQAIPTPDHFWPVLYALATKQPDERIEFFNENLVMGSLSMTSFIIH